MTTKKKICLLGAFATGKTSLVRRRVHDTFSDTYFTTIGVRIDKLQLSIDGRPLDLVVWDLHGEDRFQSVQPAYMRGAAGLLVVADLSRPDTFDVGRELERRARAAIGVVPVVWAFNKKDLADAEHAVPRDLVEHGILTSARTGEGVTEAFDRLGRAMLSEGRSRAR